MALNLARVQGRHAVTPRSGARVGSRGRRLVTAALGRPGHQPAGTMTGARGASLDVPHRLAGVPPREPRVSRSLAQVEPWDEILPQAEGRGGTPIGERALQSARRAQVRWIRTRVDRRSAFLFLLSYIRGSKRRS